MGGWIVWGREKRGGGGERGEGDGEWGFMLTSLFIATAKINV